MSVSSSTPSTPNECLTRLGFLYQTKHCDTLLSQIINETHWSQDSFTAYGRRFEIPRLQAWIADNGIQYSYSNNLLQTQPWTELLNNIKCDVERKTGHRFNSVLLTYYRDGEDHVTWHADDEKELGPEPYIGSLSLGTKREFLFRHKQTGEIEKFNLRNGELLLMHPEFQAYWDHCVPVKPEVNDPRVNLTFRQVVTSN